MEVMEEKLVDISRFGLCGPFCPALLALYSGISGFWPRESALTSRKRPLLWESGSGYEMTCDWEREAALLGEPCRRKAVE